MNFARPRLQRDSRRDHAIQQNVTHELDVRNGFAGRLSPLFDERPEFRFDRCRCQTQRQSPHSGRQSRSRTPGLDSDPGRKLKRNRLCNRRRDAVPAPLFCNHLMIEIHFVNFMLLLIFLSQLAQGWPQPFFHLPVPELEGLW
ncbi:MAG TPA: hypothetical protein VG273_11775 [Bryobacteraceae bacterium]|jgi:hypothetical protein|nr:hypothetical protein [Bryobacteraceae bacterium]